MVLGAFISASGSIIISLGKWYWVPLFQPVGALLYHSVNDIGCLYFGQWEHLLYHSVIYGLFHFQSASPGENRSVQMLPRDITAPIHL